MPVGGGTAEHTEWGAFWRKCAQDGGECVGLTGEVMLDPLVSCGIPVYRSAVTEHGGLADFPRV